MKIAKLFKSFAVLMAAALLAAACSSSSESSGSSSTSTTAAVGATDDPVADAPANPAPASAVPAVPPARATSGEFSIVAPAPDPTLVGVDPDVRIGVLANGLTYYVRHNDSPGGRLQLRLVVNAGSLQQKDPDSGLAHFVEHMLFNGTEKFPGNELDKVLEDLGLSIGADVNAFTSFDETVYSLEVAARDRDAVDQGFDVLAEWASAATIEPGDVIDERGVVREERRLRTESPEGVQFDVFLDVYTMDSSYFGASPIGTADGILATTADDAREFYDRWYRPELMAVVAVGDLSVDDMIEEIEQRFAELESRGDNAPHADVVAGPIDERWVEVLVDAETSARRVSLDYWIPSWDRGTVGGERLEYMESLLGEVIRNRLNDAVDRGELDAISPFAGPFDVTRKRRFLGLNFGGEDLAVATEQVIAELRRMEVLGFSEPEVERVIESFRSDLDQVLDSLGTRQDAGFAGEYVNHFLEGAAIDEATAAHARLSSVLDELAAADLTNHFRYLMSISAPLLVALGQDESDVPTVDELEAALERGLAVSVDGSSGSAEEVAISALMAPPDRVRPIERNRLSDVDGFELVFENGARALFVHSDISEGAISLIAMGDGGWSVLNLRDAQLAAVATSAADQSGLGEFDSVQLNQFLAKSVVSFSPFIDEVDEGFAGSAATDEAEVLLQLLHLSVTAPRVDQAAFASAVESAETGIRAAASDPQTLSFIEMFDARYGGSDYPRIVPDASALESFTAEEALGIYTARLGNVDDLIVAVAGDADPDTIEDLFERYVGTLPAGESDSFVDLWPSPPARVVRRSVTAGSAAAGAGVDFLFAAEVEIDDRTELTVAILENIVDSRLFDAVREELGASYGAGVFSTVSTRPDDVVEMFVVASGDPDRLGLITETVLESVRDLAANGPSSVEFSRARGILLSDYELVSNFNLLTMLLDMARADSTDPFTRGEAFDVIDAISRREVADLAAELFPADRWIQVTRTP